MMEYGRLSKGKMEKALSYDYYTTNIPKSEDYVMTEDQKKMIRLYDLRNRAVKEHKRQDQEVLDWVIARMEPAAGINREPLQECYTAPLPGILTDEFFMKHDMHQTWDCPHCPSKERCFMAEKAQRIPKEYGGLGLCPNLRRRG